MPDLGKIDVTTFNSVIAPNLGASRDDVAIGPRHGVDFGVIDVDGSAVVTATDPLSILPPLGFERAGQLALDVVLADVAVSGISPTHLAVSLTLPPEMTDSHLEDMWRGLSGRADELGVSIVSGHTARYAGVEYSWIGGATAIGIGEWDDLVRPDGANPGDDIVVATGPGAEVTGLFSSLFPNQLNLSDAVLDIATERLDDFGVVRDAETAFDAGSVTAMHDATEGGLQGALIEMATGAGVSFQIESDSVPLAPGVSDVCDAIDVDPWHVTSAGTLVIAVESDDGAAVADALQRRGTPAGVVGSVTQGDGVFVDGKRISRLKTDPSWEAFARFTGNAQ